MKKRIFILFVLILITNIILSNTISPVPLKDLNEKMINFIKENKQLFDKQYEKSQDQVDFRNNINNNSRDVIEITCPVFLLQFPDNGKTVQPRFFDNLLNDFSQLKRNYPNTRNVTSVKGYYLEESNYKVQINFDIIEWTMMDNNYSYYVDGQYGFGYYPRNTHGMFEDLINKVDPFIDFSDYDFNDNGYQDFIILIHSGPGQEVTNEESDMWSHMISYEMETNDNIKTYSYSVQPEYVENPNDGTIGVFVHELGHLIFGLVDLYDTDYSSHGIGRFGIMASGSWGSLDDNKDGSQPTPFTQYHKIDIGFEGHFTVTENNHDSITLERGDILKMKHPVLFREYLLVHFPEKTSYSKQIPSNSNETGLIIEHIDETRPNNDEEWYPNLGDPMKTGRYRVQIKQKDGLYELERKISKDNKGESKDRFYEGDTLIYNSNDGFDFEWYYTIENERYYDITNIVYDKINDEYTIYFDGEEPEIENLKSYKIIVFKNKLNNYNVLIKTKDGSVPILESNNINNIPSYFKKENNIYFYEMTKNEVNNIFVNGKYLIDYGI